MLPKRIIYVAKVIPALEYKRVRMQAARNERSNLTMPVQEVSFPFPVTVWAVQTEQQLPNGPYVKHTDPAASMGDAVIMKSQTSDDVARAVQTWCNTMAAGVGIVQVIGVTLTVVGAELLGKPLPAQSATAVNVGDVIVYTIKKRQPDVHEVGLCPLGYGKSGSGLCNGSVAGQYRNSNPIAGETVVIKSCPLGLCGLSYLDVCSCCPLPCCCIPFIGCCGNGAWIGFPPFQFSCLSFDGDTLWYQTFAKQLRLEKIPENSSTYRI